MKWMKFHQFTCKLYICLLFFSLRLDVSFSSALLSQQSRLYMVISAVAIAFASDVIVDTNALIYVKFLSPTFYTISQHKIDIMS